MTFKQQYLHENGPFAFDFQAERTEVYNRIINTFTEYPPNTWTHYGINPITLVDGYKQIYGMEANQVANIVNMLISYLLERKGLTG